MGKFSLLALNDHNSERKSIILVDHKEGREHLFSGSMEGKHMSFWFTSDKGSSDKELSEINIDMSFENMVGKYLSPEFKARFAHEREGISRTNV